MIFSDHNLFYVALFVLIFLLSLFTISRIIKTSIKYNLMDVPVDRSSHKIKVPSLGGIAFFINIILCSLLVEYYQMNPAVIIFLFSCSIIFSVGVVDDIFDVSAGKKVIYELLAIIIFVVGSNAYISSFHGFLGLEEIPVFIGVPFSVLLVLFIVQAYNLIDGVDGMAGTLGIVVFTSFGFFFLLLKDAFFLGVCITCIASLGSFLFFNLSKKHKIFMGDTGSLLIGFIIGILTIKLLTFSNVEMQKIPFEIQKIPLLIIFTLFIPLFDVFRVMLCRFLNKKPVFKADHNHLHHVMCDYGFSHLKTSLVCAIYTIITVFIAFLLAFYSSIQWMFFAFFINVFIVFSLSLYINNTRTAIKTKKAISLITKKIFSSKK